MSMTILSICLSEKTTIAISLKECFSNIRVSYSIIGATFITVLTLTNRYKEEKVEVSVKWSITLAIMNTIIFYFVCCYNILGFSEEIYKPLMLVCIIFIANLYKKVRKDYLNILKKFKE